MGWSGGIAAMGATGGEGLAVSLPWALQLGWSSGVTAMGAADGEGFRIVGESCGGFGI